MKSSIKAKPLRNPGHSLEKKLQDIFFDDLLFPVLVTCVLVAQAVGEWWQWYNPTPPAPVAMSVLALLFASYAMWKIARTIPKARRVRQGLEGERAVAQFLHRLIASDAAVLHDFPCDGFNLDHVIVHPTGIYYVETKTLSKPLKGECKLFFDGETVSRRGRDLPRNPVVQARRGAQWLSGFVRNRTGLDLPVRGVVVFPGWFIESSPAARNSDVWVLEPKALPAFIKNQRPCITLEAQGACVRAMRNHIRATDL